MHYEVSIWYLVLLFLAGVIYGGALTLIITLVKLKKVQKKLGKGESMVAFLDNMSKQCEMLETRLKEHKEAESKVTHLVEDKMKINATIMDLIEKNRWLYKRLTALTAMLEMKNKNLFKN